MYHFKSFLIIQVILSKIDLETSQYAWNIDQTKSPQEISKQGQHKKMYLLALKAEDKTKMDPRYGKSDLSTELLNVEINFKPLRVATFECTIFLKFFDLKYSRTLNCK